LILLNGPPGVGKSTIARRLRDDRPLSLLVDFDELWLLIGDWQHQEGKGQELAIAAGLAMARAHLHAGYDVIAPQLALGPDFFEAVDAIVAETASVCHEIVLTAHPERVAARFRRRRAERTSAGESDVSTNIPDDRVDDVIARAIEELTALTAARPQTTVIATDDGVESTYERVRDVLQQRGGRPARAGRTDAPGDERGQGRRARNA
jgi:broad-specificity NMP kinase